MTSGSLARRPAPRVPSRAERIASWTILAVLPIVAGAVYLKGRTYDPHLFALNPALLSNARTGAATGGPSGVALSRDPDLPVPATMLPRRLASLGWDADAPPERFTRATLYQKIDGRADEYLQNGFAGLETISYVRGNSFIDVFIYDMSDAARARSRLLGEQPHDAVPAAIGAEGYCVAASCFFADGRYYVQVVGSDPGAETVRAVGDAARGISALTRQQQR